MQTAQDMLASLPLAVIMIDAADRIVEVNPAAEDMLGVGAPGVVCASLWQHIQPDEVIRQAISRTRRSKAPLFVADCELSRAGLGVRGVMRQCSVHVAPLTTFNASLVLAIHTRELANQHSVGEEARAAARSAIGMAEMLAHEIRNPLTGIAGAAQLLAPGLAPHDRELTDLICDESGRIVRLLDQVEAFGNIAPPNLQPVNLHGMLDRARASAVLGFARTARIRTDYDPSLPPALGDADQLVQAILNVIRNAIEATGGQAGKPCPERAATAASDANSSGAAPEAAIVIRTFFDSTMRLRQPGADPLPLPLQIEVVDNGPGVDRNIREMMFDPFVSGRPEGRGLGLALTGRIIADHGGVITVDSAPGRTAIRISLPRAV